MQAFKAHFGSGRLVLNEPTGVPDGVEVEMAVIDGNQRDDAERACGPYEEHRTGRIMRPDRLAPLLALRSMP